jgi:hypothetical protein
MFHSKFSRVAQLGWGMRGQKFWPVFLLTAALLSGCGNDSDATQVGARGDPRGAEGGSSELRLPLQCGSGEGESTYHIDRPADSRGTPTQGGAVREVLSYALPGFNGEIPDRPPEARAARPSDPFVVSSIDERHAAVAFRESGRVGATMALSRTEAGGWTADAITICTGLLERAGQ